MRSFRSRMLNQMLTITVASSFACLWSGLGRHASAGQLEIEAMPHTAILDARGSTAIELGILSIDRLVSPRIDGHLVAEGMLTSSTLVARPDGTASYTYNDQFLRHYRGRNQDLSVTPEGDEYEDLLSSTSRQLPKVLLDLHSHPTESMYFNSGEDILWWTGDLVYRFAFGHPVTDLRLSTGDRDRCTWVGDWDWQEGRAVIISASTDGTEWSEIWRSSGQGGRTRVHAVLPPDLLGAETVYLRFRGEDSNVLFNLHVSAELAAPELAEVVALNCGLNERVFTDAGESSHRAVVFWDDSEVSVASASERIIYPTNRPSVDTGEHEITILFPEEVAVVIEKTGSGGVAGIGRIVVGQSEVLSRPPGVPLQPPWLETLSDDDVGGITDWEAYLRERAADPNLAWPRRGGRELGAADLSDATILDAAVEGTSVTLRVMVESGNDVGELKWILTPESMELAGRRYRGVAWKIRLEDLDSAQAFRVVETMDVRFGDWTFAQFWGGFVDSDLDLASPLQIPESTYFGGAQPFYFAGGRRGAVVSFFDEPVAAKVEVSEDSARHLVRIRVPFDAETVRETPSRYLLWTDDPLASRWSANDEWAALLDSFIEWYRAPLDLGVTDPKPMLVWTSPPEDVYADFIDYGPPSLEQSWLYEYATTSLPVAAGLGIRAILIQPPWESDAEHGPDLLEGSGGWGSGHAPWRLEISEAIGGDRALAELTSRAHQLGVKIILWSGPAHLSTSSPLLVDNPDWVAWRRDGTPEDFGWGDIAGLDLDRGYLQYALGQYAQVHATTEIDGIWQDSFLTFGLLTDYRRAQTAPQLGHTLAMQQQMWRLGMTEVHIEGAGAVGLSHSYGGYEPSPELPMPTEEDLSALETIRNHEYALYRTVAYLPLDAAVYYRALASKGAIGIANLGELTSLAPNELALYVQANHDHARVAELMKRRHLIGTDDGEWLGVLWTGSALRGQALFAFTTFRHTVQGSGVVKDVTTETILGDVASFETEPMHTYIIGPPLLRDRVAEDR